MNRFVGFIVGALLGGLVGATLALLLAPSSGEELRFQIRDRAITLQDDVKKAATDRRAELEEQLAAMRAPKQAKAE